MFHQNMNFFYPQSTKFNSLTLKENEWRSLADMLPTFRHTMTDCIEGHRKPIEVPDYSLSNNVMVSIEKYVPAGGNRSHILFSVTDRSGPFPWMRVSLSKDEFFSLCLKMKLAEDIIRVNKKIVNL